jgi:hypothetical protein
MRTYLTTTVAQAEAIFREGWADTHEEFGRNGVYLSTVPLDANDGFDGNVTLCLEVPDDTFGEYEVTDELQAQAGYRLGLVPAAALNQLEAPKVYDHAYAGSSRKEMLDAIRAWESANSKSAHANAQEMRDAIDFFDRIGWLTPIKLQEEQE